MIKSYFKIAFRNLTKNKVSSFINIGGLAVGMAVAILIGLWIFDELSAAGALVITLFTVSFQAIRTALANPVKALRSE